jgi:hypothetical protein
MKIELLKLAHARSGDKGDTANVGVIALKDEFYPILAREVTAEKVKAHFGEIVKGRVERFELPNLKALNFLLHESLGGGGTLSLMTDAQGKTFSTALLRMKIDVSDAEARDLGIKNFLRKRRPDRDRKNVDFDCQNFQSTGGMNYERKNKI